MCVSGCQDVAAALPGRHLGMVEIMHSFWCSLLCSAGVDDGTKLRIKGKGDAGLKGGEPGSSFVC